MVPNVGHMAGPSEFKAHLDAISTAIAEDDRLTARTRYRQALTVLPQLPATATDGTSIAYSQAAEALRMLRMEINSMGDGGIIRQSVEFKPLGYDESNEAVS